MGNDACVGRAGARAQPYASGTAFGQLTRTEHDLVGDFCRLSSSSIVLMSFNLRAMDQPDRGPRSWAARRRAVVRVLQKYRPEVVATQEGFAQQIADICAALPHYRAVGKSRTHPSDQETCSVLFDAAVLELVSDKTVWLSEAPDRPGSKSWDSSLPRIATVATIKHQTQGTLAVVSTHYDHRGIVARERGTEVLLRHALPLELPAVLAGDFNLPKGGAVWRRLCEGDFFRDALCEVPCMAAQPGTFHDYSGGPFAVSPSANHQGHIDWVLARAGRGKDVSSVIPRQAALVTLSWTDGGEVLYPSDHLPIVVEFDLLGPDGPKAAAAEERRQSLERNLTDRACAWAAAEPHWEAVNGGGICPDAVLGEMRLGGADAEGEPLYVGRAWHKGGWIPGGVSPRLTLCLVPSGCQEHGYSEYEVLCMPKGSYRWERDSLGAFPPGAVPAGHFYVARAAVAGRRALGKLHPEHGVCYVPHEGREHKCSEYEVLVSDYHSCVSVA